MAVSFRLSLVDAVTAPAKMAGASLGSITQQAKTLQGAMTSLEKQMTKATALGDATKVAKLQGDYSKFSGALNQLGPEAAEGAEGMAALSGAVAAGAAAVAAAAVAIGALVVEGAKLALEMTELREKSVATFSALAGGREAGEAMLGTVDALRSKLGMTRAELVPFAEQLLAMGISAKDAGGQLTALATVKAVGIDGGPEEYLNILKKIQGQAKLSSKDLANLYKTGVNVNDLAGSMGLSIKQLQAGLKNGTVDSKKFGQALEQAVTTKGVGALAQQANNLSNQWAIFKENLGQLFEGVDAKPFLDAMKDLLGIFGQNTASGQTFKAAITGAFTSIFKIAAKVLPYIKTGIEIAIIWFLKAYIAVKKFLSSQQGAMTLKVVIGALAITAGVLAAAMTLAVGPFILMAAAGGVLVAAVVEIIAWLARLESAASDAAWGFIAGLVNGIKNGTGLVIDAVKNLGSSMLNGVKSTLGIHSPSREMMKLGGHTVAGFTQGVQAANDNVASASAGMGAAAMGGAAKGASGGGGGGINIGPINLTVNGAGNVQEAAEAFEEKLSLTLEKFALSLGGGLAA